MIQVCETSWLAKNVKKQVHCITEYYIQHDIPKAQKVTMIMVTKRGWNSPMGRQSNVVQHLSSAKNQQKHKKAKYFNIRIIWQEHFIASPKFGWCSQRE